MYQNHLVTLKEKKRKGSKAGRRGGRKGGIQPPGTEATESEYSGLGEEQIQDFSGPEIYVICCLSLRKIQALVKIHVNNGP